MKLTSGMRALCGERGFVLQWFAVCPFFRTSTTVTATVASIILLKEKCKVTVASH